MFTVRAMVFSLVLLVAFVLVYPTLGTYLQTRAEVRQLTAQRDAAVAEKSDLEAELRRWDDQAYVIAQARERLSFVMPGETAFVVVDPQTVPDAPAADDGPVSTAADGATRPWYSSVWDSVEIAGGLDVDGTDPAAPAAPPASDAPPAPDAPAGDADADPAG
ncbi:septation ring formation regulator EzrA [Cellulomonas sp. B6]|jgi:cell division protein FtsB|nr:septation ring formation regulator EzrA [Cellulomonas sp. B6]